MSYSVLIVDDSIVVRKVLTKTFGMTDIPISNIFQAENGQVGLDILKSNSVDIIFLDINMPVMNGMQFMEELTNIPDLKSTPVIVVSTEGSKDRKEELLNYGVKAYLRKPVTPEDLVNTINSVLGENKGVENNE